MAAKIKSLRKWFVVVLVIAMFSGGVSMTVAEESSGSSKPKSRAKADSSGKKKESSGKKKESGKRARGRARGGRSSRSSKSK